jgi:hypothetical protein
VTDAPPDYTTMTGAEFQRAVGTDPERWAEAFMQRHRNALQRDALTDYFRNAMDAARKDRIGRALGLDEGPNG